MKNAIVLIIAIACIFPSVSKALPFETTVTVSEEKVLREIFDSSPHEKAWVLVDMIRTSKGKERLNSLKAQLSVICESERRRLLHYIEENAQRLQELETELLFEEDSKKIKVLQDEFFLIAKAKQQNENRLVEIEKIEKISR